MMKAYFDLTKTSIILFVLLSALAGYAMSFPLGQPLDIWHPTLMMVGLYLVSASSFALNQVQERTRDKKMPRTQQRPLVTGKVLPWQAYVIGAIFAIAGVVALYVVSPLAAGLAVLTMVLYNLFYTMIWKRYWAFGAVPGAIPGALPVVIGYSANSTAIFSSESMYLFLIMFLWQMPHFWCLAIRFRDDYSKGGFPVLPAKIGVPRTLYHIGLYVFAYAGLAIVSPWFMQVNVLYLLLVVPVTFKVIYEFFKFFHAKESKAWLPFFLWINLSLLVYIGVPAADKWISYFMMYL